MEITSLDLFGHTFAECLTLDQPYRVNRDMRNDACLAYIQAGEQELFSPTRKIVVKDNESILMKCGSYIANFKEVTPTSQFKSVVFHLDPETIGKAFTNDDLNFLRVSRSRSPIDPALKINQNDLLDGFVVSMMPYFNNPTLASEELLLLKLKELIYILSDSGKNELVTQIIGTVYIPEDIAFDQIINANLYNNLSIPELAHLTLRSESTFKRDFKNWYNENPGKYFKTKRLQKASELLKDTSLQIIEIAWDCGFESGAHFSDSFNNHFGKSPKEYRNELI